MNIISWNVNGIRSILKKGFLDWVEKTDPDILCLQETRIPTDQLDLFLSSQNGYKTYWNESKTRKGYSGVSVWTKIKPLKVIYGFGIERFDQEGRVLILEFSNFTLLNIYFPNGKSRNERLKYKMDFYDETLKYCQKILKKGKKLIVCGDYNTAHQAIDLARPKENEETSGFLPIERDWLDKWTNIGFVDTFRMTHPDEPNHYTWWSMRSGARERNVGWRIDYHFVSENFKNQIKESNLHPQVMGSDHCPIELIVDV